MDRSKYIGSSDARDIMYGNWFDLWSIKTNRVERVDLSDNFKVQLGVHTEEFHIDWTLKRLFAEHPYYCRIPQAVDQQHTTTLTIDDTPFGCHYDALITEAAADDLIPIPVEVKHTGRYKNAVQAASFYMPQLQHLMMCNHSENLLFSAICGTEEPERVWVSRDDEFIEHYKQNAIRFWAYVRDDIGPPPVFDHNAINLTADVAQTLTDKVKINGFKRRSIASNNYAMSLVPEFIETKKQAKRHDEIKSDLKGLMADDENELYSDQLVLKRNKAGSIIIRVNQEA